MARPLHILLACDANDDAELLRRELGKLDASVTIVRVETVEAMRAALAARPPDLVISDDHPPELSASGALKVLHERGLDIPFIVVSGAIGEVRAVELMRLGAHDFVFEHDLSRLEQVIARELREAADRAARRVADQRKDQYVAMIGHELRKPLAPIGTALELMHMRGTDSDHEVTVIKRQVEHLQRLVDDLLDVSLLTHGDLALHRARVDVREVVARAIELARSGLDQRRHELAVDQPAAPVTVAGDRDRLGQIVANLLSNAAKYTPNEGHITIRVAAEGEHAVVEVEDDGVGIDPGVVPFVFDPFVQCPPALAGRGMPPAGSAAEWRRGSSIDRQRGGLGLGLAIVKSLVELHGGTISVDSAPGRGSKFTVRLPLAPTQPLAARPSPSASSGMTPAGSPDPCVLIVDDNVDAAHLLAEFLGDLGYKTCVAHDGPSALRLAAQQHPTVALLDIGLPIMDGYELGSRLKRDHSELRMIAITGYGDPADRRRSEQSGFDAHLVKPIDLSGLVDVLRAEP